MTIRSEVVIGTVGWMMLLIVGAFYLGVQMSSPTCPQTDRAKRCIAAGGEHYTLYKDGIETCWRSTEIEL